MLPLIVVLLATPQIDPTVPAVTRQCEYDQQPLDLGFDAFDQNLNGGWRALAQQPGCEREVADIVRDYREKYSAIMPLLFWHEAQLRAIAGDTDEAVFLMKKSREPAGGDQSGWNLYVDATIGFLQKDKRRFRVAQDRLERFKKPNAWPTDAEWPQNGNVVAGLWNCFGQPYKIAYGVACRPVGKGPQ